MVTFGLNVDGVWLLAEPDQKLAVIADCKVPLLVNLDHSGRLLLEISLKRDRVDQLHQNNNQPNPKNNPKPTITPSLPQLLRCPINISTNIKYNYY